MSVWRRYSTLTIPRWDLFGTLADLRIGFRRATSAKQQKQARTQANKPKAEPKAKAEKEKATKGSDSDLKAKSKDKKSTKKVRLSIEVRPLIR